MDVSGRTCSMYVIFMGYSLEIYETSIHIYLLYIAQIVPVTFKDRVHVVQHGLERVTSGRTTWHFSPEPGYKPDNQMSVI